MNTDGKDDVYRHSLTLMTYQTTKTTTTTIYGIMGTTTTTTTTPEHHLNLLQKFKRATPPFHIDTY